jgi:DNA-directed RNA polymerase subunit RPC12/RpoP
MKYLDALKNENPYHEELQKLQKGFFTVFTVQEGSTFLKKADDKRVDGKPTKARGYGCAGCGSKIYQTIQAWKMNELDQSSPWQYEHRLGTAWKCEGCGAVFQIIGGTKGSQYIT